MNYHPPTSRGRPAAVTNRLAAIMIHIPRYSVRGASRLARDANVSKDAVSCLLRGEGYPSYGLIHQIAEALSRRMGKPLDLREIAVTKGSSYKTKYPCALFGCTCLPDWAYRRDGSLKPDWEGIQPGQWTYDHTEDLTA